MARLKHLICLRTHYAEAFEGNMIYYATVNADY